METPIKREEWDFSRLESRELIPALLWESRREYDYVDELVATAEAWLDGKLSSKRAPMRKDKRTGRRPRYNTNFSEADTARLRTLSAFDEFVPLRDFSFLDSWSAKQRHEEWDRWLAGYLRPLVKNHPLPWQCLPAKERNRLCDIFERNRDANIVSIGAWWDAVAQYRKVKPDRSAPLKFDYHEHTSVLLTFDWRFSKKRILAAFGQLLKTLEPKSAIPIKKWDRRGKKDRDLLVMLERFAIMRLLHCYTLAETKRVLPEAWEHYSHRKWYDERRQALKDFRDLIHQRDSNSNFPKSWQTKADRTKKGAQLPGK